MSAADLIPIIAPELVGHAELAGAITLADGQIGINVGGTQRDTLVAYLAAHILTLASRASATGAASGEITSIREGALAMTFSTGGAAGPSSTLAATSYGAEYLRIARAYVFAPGTRAAC